MSDFPSVFRIQHVASGSFMTVSETTGNPVVGGQPAKIDKKSHFQLVPVSSGGYRLKNVASGQEVHFDAARNGMLFAATTGSVFFIRKESNGQFAIHVNRSPNYVVDLEQANMLDENLYAIRLVQEKNAKSPLWTLGAVEEEKPKPPPVCYPFPPGIYVIRNVKTGTVMDLEGAVDGEGVNIQGHEANNGANQRWHVMPSGNGSNMTIQNVATDEYAAYPNMSKKQLLSRPSGRPSIKSRQLTRDSSEYISIAPVELATHVVDLTKGLEANRTPICLWVKHTEDQQKWYFERSF
ncbi:ricin-type beta-trefoil lectin domain protein [Ceratobasidium sp. AG-Ba]|nr:ricin-type beta-trefoil lectin domain protein [Ceratobasidium sp. AG-Ba]